MTVLSIEDWPCLTASLPGSQIGEWQGKVPGAAILARIAWKYIFSRKSQILLQFKIHQLGVTGSFRDFYTALANTIAPWLLVVCLFAVKEALHASFEDCCLPSLISERSDRLAWKAAWERSRWKSRNDPVTPMYASWCSALQEFHVSVPCCRSSICSCFAMYFLFSVSFALIIEKGMWVIKFKLSMLLSWICKVIRRSCHKDYTVPATASALTHPNESNRRSERSQRWAKMTAIPRTWQRHEETQGNKKGTINRLAKPSNKAEVRTKNTLLLCS